MRYYLIAGEASGDLHASHLMRALKAQDKDAESRAQLVAAVHAQLAKINGYKK